MPRSGQFRDEGNAGGPGTSSKPFARLSILCAAASARPRSMNGIASTSVRIQARLAEIRNPAVDWRFVVASVLAGIALATVFRAAFSAYFLLDDFGMLSIARFLDNPFEPFVRNHIPGGIFYRPVGMLLWWLSERGFGSGAFAHYLLNLLLHGAVAVALGSLVARLCDNRWGRIDGGCLLRPAPDRPRHGIVVVGSLRSARPAVWSHRSAGGPRIQSPRWPAIVLGHARFPRHGSVVQGDCTGLLRGGTGDLPEH